MKNTSYKNKQFVLLGMTFLSVAGIAGCSKVELAQSTVTLELGDELSENVADYLQDPDEKILKGASLDLSAVDETKVGSYNAAVAYDGKNYPFTVEVKDTTSPQCKAKDYIYMQPGTLTMDDLVTEIKDASETSSGIVSCEQKEDLVVCDYDDMLQEKAVVDTTDSYDGADYQESVQLDDEGCYEVTAQVKDSEGNFTDITLNVYVDGTAPELAQNVIDLDLLFLLTGLVNDGMTLMHHQQTVAVFYGVTQVMSHHDGREMLLFYHLIRQLHNDVCGFRIQCCRVLIQK